MIGYVTVLSDADPTLLNSTRQFGSFASGRAVQHGLNMTLETADSSASDKSTSAVVTGRPKATRAAAAVAAVRNIIVAIVLFTRGALRTSILRRP